VAGGTGLYIKALLKGLFRADARDPELRRRLKAEAASLGSPVLHARLASGDPQTAARLHPNDAQRIVRALEVLEVTGQPISRLQAQHGFGDSPLDALKIGLAMDRDVLYARIERRVDAMLAQGLEEEVRGLLDRGYHPGLKSMQAIGYSHVIGLIAGRTDRAECIRTLKRDTRRYAKRQLTWFRADPDVAWAPAERTDELVSACLAYLDSPPPGRLPRAFAAWKKS
jgi:tRNA dimethylallyltransferase